MRTGPSSFRRASDSPKRQQTIDSQGTSAGFSLIEVTLAIGIIAFGLIAIFGLLPSGLNLVRESSEEATAVNIMGAIAYNLRAGNNVPSPNTTTDIYYDRTGIELPNASSANADLKALIQISGASPPRMASIQVHWPAANPSSSVETLIMLRP